MSVTHTDVAIRNRLLSGDEAAFKALFDDYFPKLYRFALARLGNDHTEAVEAVQQTFCKAFEHLGSYRGEASLYGWMCQICRNVVTDAGRRRHRELQRTPLPEDDASIEGVLDALCAPTAKQPEQDAARGELVRLVQATLDRLPSRYGDVLEWKYIDGLSVKEIGARLAIGPKAAESLLTRARSAFREAVAAVGSAAELIADGGAGE